MTILSIMLTGNTLFCIRFLNCVAPTSLKKMEDRIIDFVDLKVINAMIWITLFCICMIYICFLH